MTVKRGPAVVGLTGAVTAMAGLGVAVVPPPPPPPAAAAAGVRGLVWSPGAPTGVAMLGRPMDVGPLISSMVSQSLTHSPQILCL